MHFTSLLLGALSLSNVVLCKETRFSGSLASRANAMISVRHVDSGSAAKRSWLTAAMLPKMVDSSTEPADLIKRAGITIGPGGSLQLGGGKGQSGGGAAQGATNQTVAGGAALESAKNNTGGGLTIGGLALGGPNGGITVNNGAQGEQQGQPAAAQPAGEAVAGEAKAGEAKAGEAKAGETAALRESGQFDGNAGITTDKAGNAVNLGGDLGITKGSDSSTSVGGESGINIAPRAIEVPGQ
ncbi:hypothetical protein BJ170DRAFT_335494 [Xylariales sp. AK1849]|nr:hypothetical protein BJ170DRAFT_335494 [Xylariales sp. AK1849]